MKNVTQNYWLFSPATDLLAFLGSAVISLLLLAFGWQFGFLNSETPDLMWISASLLIDVAHVWATTFRVYFDAEEFKRRMLLYVSVPFAGYVLGVVLYSEGRMVFWRVLAYIAVFHFVRQQYGWVALYRAKAKERSEITWWIDAVAIYIATIYPLVYWMAASKRNFSWFVEGDFFSISTVIAKFAFPVYVVALSLYFAKSVFLYKKEGFLNIGKDIVVATTAICWYVGIISFNSDYAFTVTNVIIHGVPYFVLIYFYAQARRAKADKFYRSLTSNWLVFMATLWLLAYTEELLWNRSVWHEKGEIFGSYWNVEDIKMYIVPLLAVPQLTHYVLDGFIWKRKNNKQIGLI
ncbi:MAG: hypothetical protein ACK5NT_08340 [Pyrinomonadaceae bacterium]